MFQFEQRKNLRSEHPPIYKLPIKSIHSPGHKPGLVRFNGLVIQPSRPIRLRYPYASNKQRYDQSPSINPKRTLNYLIEVRNILISSKTTSPQLRHKQNAQRAVGRRRP